MPNSHGAPEPSASSRNRRDACQACAKVSAVRSKLAVSDPVCRTNHERIQTA